MSRICGIVGPDWSKEHIHGALAKLVLPLCHSSDFQIEQVDQAHCGLARIFFRSYNFSTHLYSNEDKTVTCIFSGYLFEPSKMAEKLERHERNEPNTFNSAFLFGNLYPRLGSQMLKNLSGSFVFALWEKESATLTIGTDRFGVIPLYYQITNNSLAFSSEIKSLTALNPDQGTDTLALSELFSLGSPQGDKTLYPAIKRLPPATVLTWQNGRCTFDRYWSFADIPTRPSISVPEFVEVAQRLLSRSVTKLVGQIENPLCFLSGGYDSRRILLELVNHSKPVTAYTAPTVQHDCPFTFDVPIARALCQALGVRHVVSDLPKTSSYGMLARHAQTLLDYETDSHAWILPLLADLPVTPGVNFDGLGGDVLFEFNWTYPHLADLTGNPEALASAVMERYPDLWSGCFSTPPPSLSLTDRHRQTFEELPNIADRIVLFYFSGWTRRKTALFAERLLSLKLDSVYPFLDYDLVEHVFRLPPLARRQSEVSKLMLLLANPEIAKSIPTSHDPELATSTNHRYDDFRTLLPNNYWLKMQAAIHRSAAIDIARLRQLFRELSRESRISTLANLIPIPSNIMPRRVTVASWRLPLVGLCARQRYFSHSPAESTRHLQSARKFVYGKS